jgi:hypothetical protein
VVGSASAADNSGKKGHRWPDRRSAVGTDAKRDRPGPRGPKYKRTKPITAAGPRAGICRFRENQTWLIFNRQIVSASSLSRPSSVRKQHLRVDSNVHLDVVSNRLQQKGSGSHAKSRCARSLAAPLQDRILRLTKMRCFSAHDGTGAGCCLEPRRSFAPCQAIRGGFRAGFLRSPRTVAMRAAPAPAAHRAGSGRGPAARLG